MLRRGDNTFSVESSSLLSHLDYIFDPLSYPLKTLSPEFHIENSAHVFEVVRRIILEVLLTAMRQQIPMDYICDFGPYDDKRILICFLICSLLSS